MSDCRCGCASCAPHHAENCTHTTSSNPIDIEPTDRPLVKRIEQPGVLIHKTLAQLLGVTEKSPAAIEWRERMEQLDRSEKRVWAR